MSDIKDNARPALAVLDWGIGGIDFYRIFKEHYPEVGVCYLSDTGAVPYGKQTKEQLRERLGRVITFLEQRGVTSLVVACNAMSTVLPEMRFPNGFQMTGVIEPALAAVRTMKGEKVGIVGGRRTILSGAYRGPLRAVFPVVRQRIAQPLSGLIEKGEKDTPLFHSALKKIMAPLKKSDILILACTHYPAAWEAFQALAPGAQLVSPADETLAWVKAHWQIKEDAASDVFYTTGYPDEMRRASKIAFGTEIGEIQTIEL